jgi:hypothetical protein
MLNRHSERRRDAKSDKERLPIIEAEMALIRAKCPSLSLSVLRLIKQTRIMEKMGRVR